MSLTISALNVYPVKSLGGFSLQQCRLELTGLTYDRRWMVVRPDGKMLTQRSHPQMALIGTSIENNSLVLDCFGMDSHTVPPTEATMNRVSSEVWGDEVPGIDLGDETARWLSQAIGDRCRLIAFPASEERLCDPEVSLPGDHTLYADGFPLLVVSQASLDKLNRKLEAPVSMSRFRPNIVVDGADPHAEDEWKAVQIGEIGLRLVQACARCSVPTVDPDAGVLAGPEPIHTLSSYRERDGEIYFGVNAAPDDEGLLSVGDVLRNIS